MELAFSGVMIDTSAYSAFTRGDERIKAIFLQAQQLLMPIISIGELRAGYAAGAHQRYNERLLQHFLDHPKVTICCVTDTTTHLYGNAYAKLRKLGKPLAMNDLWIAALTLEHDATLVTLDSDFARVPDLLIAKL